MKTVRTEAWVALVEDCFDLVLLVGSPFYIFVINDTSLRLSQETMAEIGGSAAMARLLVRRILKRVVEIRIGEEEKS